jgi:hypothetical protein
MRNVAQYEEEVELLILASNHGHILDRYIQFRLLEIYGPLNFYQLGGGGVMPSFATLRSYSRLRC